MTVRALLIGAWLALFAGSAMAQNQVAPTPPPGDNSNRIATTAFVIGAMSGGNTFLNNAPPFTTACNPTGITAVAQWCDPIIADYPLSTATAGHLSVSGAFTASQLFFGFNAGNSTLTGLNNVGVGPFSVTALTSGSQNAALGYASLQHGTSSSNIVAVGFNALAALTGGGSSVAVGSNALAANLTGFENTAVGHQSLKDSSNVANTALGYTSGVGITSGQFNLLLGAWNGTTVGITTGSNNTIIGPATGLSNPSNAIVIADGAGNIRDSYNNAVANAWARGKTDFTDQIYSTTGTPTIASGACGATTNGTVGSGSTNQSGFVSIGAAATTTCTITWSATLSVAPNSCIFFPGNAAAAATGTTVAFASAPTTASVVLNGAALANTVYRYMCL